LTWTPRWHILLLYIIQEATMETARVFWSGRSQAVRLPKDFRFEAEEVRIRRHGSSVILEPIPADWAWLDALSGPLDADFVEAAEAQPPMQERAALDEAFR
jgi:antitoxin VapB